MQKQQFQCDSFFECGQRFYETNRYDSALHFYDQSYKLACEAGDVGRQARSLERQASVHLATDDPGLALRQYLESLVLFEKVSDSSGMAKAYNILGVYYTDRNADSALLYFNRAIAINKSRNNTKALIQNEGNLAWLYQRSGKDAEAIALNSRLIEELTQAGDSTSLQVILYNLASFYQEKNNYPKALSLLRQSIRICEAVKDTVMLSTLYGNSGELLLNLGKADSARIMMEKSIQCTQMTGDIETEVQALEFLSRIDSAAGRFPQVLKHYARMRVLNDSILAQRLRNNFENSLLAYANRKKADQLEIQSLIIKNHQREKVFYLIILLLVLAGASILAAFLMIRRRQAESSRKLQENELLINRLELAQTRRKEEHQRNKIRKVESEKALKERELISVSLQVDHKNELLKTLGNRLKSGLKDEAGAGHLLKELDSLLNKGYPDPRDFDLFNEKFTALNEVFFTRLKEKHPLLTKTELRFCAYLRVRLNSAQIATILHITSEGIRKTRYRIRKKLELKPEDSLEDYISGF